MVHACRMLAPVEGSSDELFYAWIAQVLQYRGTSQGAMFDTDTLNPLLENPAVHEALKLWKQVAGLPELTGTLLYPEILQLWFTGRCAMMIGSSAVYTALQNGPFVANTGTVIMPGSEHVWWREGKEVITCNASFCRHATEYEDGLVVNHAPPGGSYVDGAINGNVERSQQLAAYTFMTWLMNGANMLEAVINPPFWPNDFFGSFVRPALLTSSNWTPYGWRDPGLSAFCSTSTTNIEHPNAAIFPRLPTSSEISAAFLDILTDFWRNDGEFAALGEEAGAVAAAKSITTALQESIDRGDRQALIVLYQKSLNIYTEDPIERAPSRGEPFPTWAVHAVVGMLSFTLCLALVVFACWLTATVRQRRDLHAKQQEAWEGIVDEAATYASSLGCPMALVSAADFLDFGSLVHFESIRDQGKLRCLDTLEKVGDFRKTFLIVNLSHQWLAPTSPDVNGVLYRIMCAAVRRAINAANLTSDLVFLWVDYCSIPQERVSGPVFEWPSAVANVLAQHATGLGVFSLPSTFFFECFPLFVCSTTPMSGALGDAGASPCLCAAVHLSV